MAVLTGWIGTVGNYQEPVGGTDSSGKAQNQELRDAPSPSALPFKGPLTWARPPASLNLNVFPPEMGMMLPAQPDHPLDI